MEFGVRKLPLFFLLSPLSLGVVAGFDFGVVVGGFGVGFGVAPGVGSGLKMIKIDENHQGRAILLIFFRIVWLFLFFVWLFLLPFKLSIAAVLCADAIVIRLNISIVDIADIADIVDIVDIIDIVDIVDIVDI